MRGAVSAVLYGDPLSNTPYSAAFIPVALRRWRVYYCMIMRSAFSILARPIC